MATITSLGFNIRSNWDGSGVKAAVSDLQVLQEQMRRISGSALKVDVVVDTDGPRGIGAARRELAAFEAQMRRISGAALNVSIHVDGMEELGRAQLYLEALQAEARDIRIGFDLNMFEYAAAEAKIALLVRDRTIHIDIDGRGIDNGIIQITNNIRTATKASEDFQTRTTRAMVMVKLVIAGVLASAGLLPAVFVAIGAAMATLPGIAAVALGGALLSRVESVRNAFSNLGDTILEIGDRAVVPMIQPVLDAVERIKGAVIGLEPVFHDTFRSAANLVRPLTDTLIELVQRIMPGFNDMLRESVPLFNGIQEGVKNFATSLSRMFTAMSTATEEFGMTWNILFTYLGRIMEAFGYSTARMAGDVNEAMGDSLRSFEGFIRGTLDGMEGFMAAVAEVNGGLNIFRTLGDVLRILFPAWGELYAAIGLTGSGINNLATGIATFIAGAMTVLAEKITLIAPYFNQFAQYVGYGFEALNRLNPILAPVAAGIWLINLALKANPFILAATAILAVIGYLYDLEQRTGQVSAFFKSAWESIGPVVMPIVDRLRDGFNAIKEAFSGMGGASGVWDKIVDTMRPVTDVISSLVDTYMPQIREIGTEFMNAFSPLWEKVKPGIMEVWDSLQDLWDRVGHPIITALRVVGAALGAIFGGVLGAVKGGLGPAFEIIVSVFNGITGVISGAIDAITAAVRVITGIIQIVIGIVKGIGAALTGNSEAFHNAMDSITSGVKNVFGGIGNLIASFGQIIKNIWDMIVGIFKNGVGLVVGIVTGFVQGIINFFKNMWDVLVGHSIVPDMINAIITWFTELPGRVLAMVRDWVMAVINFFVDLAMKVVDTWRGWIQNILDIWNNLSMIIRAAWDAVWNGIKAAAEAIWNFIRGAWDALINGIRAVWDIWSAAFRATWDAIWNGIKAAAEFVWNAIKAAFQFLVDGVRSIWDTFSSFFTDAWNNMWEGVKNTAKGIWDWITDQFGKFKDSVLDTVGFLVDKVEEIWNKITGIFSAPIEGIKGVWNGVAGAFGLPKLAMGGPVEVQHMAIGGGVRGPGSGTSDDVPAMLSNGEHVWTAREVQAAGGHENVKMMRDGVLSGKGFDPLRLAAGGPALQWMVGQQQVHAPRLQLTSGVRNEPGSYHHTGQAGDFSNAGNEGSPEMKAFASFIASTWGRQTLELIHSPFNHNIGDGRDVGTGMNGYYNAGTMSEHRNHVHWAVPHALNDDAMGAAIPGGAGYSGPSPEQIRQIEDAKNKIKIVMRDSQREALNAINMAQLKYAINPGSQSYVGAMPGLSDDYSSNADKIASLGVAEALPPSGVVKHGVGAMGKLDGALAAMGSPGGPIGGTIPEGERRAIIEQAMRITGTPPPSTAEAWLAGMNTLITRESNWNAGARNDWDSNAAKGQNSAGLAQVIPSTFAANKAPGHDNIYAPVDNVAASINYIKRTYGSIENVQQANANMPPKGYAEGTRSAAAGWSVVGEQGPELVKFSGGETVKTFDEIIAKLKETTAGNVEEMRTRLGSEIEAAINKLITANKSDADQLKSKLETCVREAVAATGMQFNIDGSGLTTEELVRKIVPQLTAFIQQGVGTLR